MNGNALDVHIPREGATGGDDPNDAEVVHAWVLDASHREHAERLLEEHLPPRSQWIHRQYTFDIGRDTCVEAAPTIDGIPLVQFGAHSHSIVAHHALFDDLEIVEDLLVTRGTDSKPTLGGSLAIRVRTRRYALATWQGYHGSILTVAHITCRDLMTS